MILRLSYSFKNISSIGDSYTLSPPVPVEACYWRLGLKKDLSGLLYVCVLCCQAKNNNETQIRLPYEVKGSLSYLFTSHDSSKNNFLNEELDVAFSFKKNPFITDGNCVFHFSSKCYNYRDLSHRGCFEHLMNEDSISIQVTVAIRTFKVIDESYNFNDATNDHDIVLQSVKCSPVGKKNFFYVHSFMLSSYSELISKQMINKKNSFETLFITLDTSSTDLRNLLQIIYFGKDLSSPREKIELLKLCKKLEVDQITKRIEDWMISFELHTLSMKAVFAWMFDLPNLKEIIKREISSEEHRKIFDCGFYQELSEDQKKDMWTSLISKSPNVLYSERST